MDAVKRRRGRCLLWGLGLLCAAIVDDASAQLTPAARPRVIAESSGVVSRDAMGRACLDVETIARGRVANPALFDHVISFENRCLKPIKVQVCVYKTADQCTSLEIPGMKRKDAVLGVGSGSQIIRYTISERR